MLPETDEVIVNRNGTTYKTTAENMANLEDTDLMLVNRDGVTYTVTGEEIKDSIQIEQEPDITNLVLTQNQVNADRYTSNQFTSTVSFSKDPFPPASIQMTAKVEGVLGLEASTSAIISNDYVGTSSTSVPLELADNTFLNDGTFEVGDVVKASESYTPETDTIDNVVEVFGGPQTTWSAYWSGQTLGSYTPDRMFSDSGLTAFESAATWTVPDGSPGIKVEESLTMIYALKAGQYIRINDIAVPQNDSGNRIDVSSLFTFPLEIRKIEISANTGNGPDLRGGPCFYADGVGIYNETQKEFAGTVISLSSEKDIELFQVDDVLQQELVTENVGIIGIEANAGPASNLDTVFQSGNVSDVYFESGNTSSPNKLVITTPVRLTKGQVFTARVTIDDGTPSGQPSSAIGNVRINGTDYQMTGNIIGNGTTNPCAYAQDLSITVPVSGYWTQFFVTGLGANVRIPICQFAIDGSQLINNQNITYITDGAKVTATNVSAKTITVDGGDWDNTNQSQVWSADLSGVDPNQGFPATNLFDGNTGSTAEAVAGGSLIFLPTGGIPYTQKVECWIQSSAGGRNFSLNDGPNVSNLGNEWTVVATGSGTINKLVCQADPSRATSWSAIRVDGKILVDKVNDSQVWSSGGGTDPDGGLVTTNVFDGRLTTYISSRPENTVITLGDGTTGVVANTSVRFYGAYQDPTNARYTVNGTQTDAVPLAFVDNSTFGWSEVTDDIYPLTLTSVGVTGTGAGAGGRFVAVEVDGELLVDQGVRDFGDNKVSTISPKQGQGTISDITGSVVTIDPYTDNCFKESQSLTHATPKPILITPQTDDITDVTGNVLTFSGDKDLLNFAAGDAVSMVNADGSAATYSATTSAITTVDLQSITGSSSGFTSGGANLYNGTGGTASTSNGSGTRAGSISFNPALPAGTSQISYYEYNGSSSSTRPMTVTISYDDATSDVINTQISAGNTRVHPVDSAKQIKSIGWSAEVANESLNINQLKLGPNVIDLSDYDQTVLTFTDNTNLQYWKDGEVVGGYQGTISGTNSVGTGIFNFATFPYENKTYTQIFDPPVPCTSFQFRARPTDGQDSMESKISINGGGFTSIQQGDIQTNYNVPSGLTSLTYKFGVQAGNTHFGPGFGQLRFDGGDLDDIVIVDSTTFTWKVVTVIGTPDLVNNTITVSGGSWSNGDTLTKSISGTGTVLTTNPQNSTMTLSANNEEWVDGYYVQTPERPAIGQIGYLEFGSNGNVTGVTLAPQPAVVMANPNPVLTFPAQFGTGETPDTELPYPTSLQTTITASNTFIDLTVNSSTASSNVLFPATTTFLGPASGTSRYTGTGVAQLTANLTTFSGREAAANTDPTDVQGALAAKQTEIDDYIAGL